MMTRTFIFAGGGTGGHLYPGLAIAREISRLSSEATGPGPRGASARSLFVCSDRALDASILEGEGAEHVSLGARPFGVKPRALARFMWSWGRCVRESRAMIRSEIERAGSRERVDVVAMGGFVAAPVVQAARVERVRVTMVNLDAVPGKANIMIARRAARVYTAARVLRRNQGRADWIRVPPIVRAEVLGTARADNTDAAKRACRERAGIDAHTRTLLVTGGSQGATSINRLMIALVEGAKHDTRTDPRAMAARILASRWQILHQCGRESESDVRQAYDAAGVRAVVRGYVKEMGDWWGAADLAVSRSGAGNVGEAWANGVPSVFLPYPYHRDQHQRHNAMEMAERGAAVIVADRIDAAATLPEFVAAIGPLLADDAALLAMIDRSRGLGPANGAEEVARGLLRGD